MRRRPKSIMICLVGTAIAAILLPEAALARQPQGASPSRWQHALEVGFDAAIIRPLSLAALLIGGGFVVPVAVFTWPFGLETTEIAVERFVTLPADDVFNRPVGEF